MTYAEHISEGVVNLLSSKLRSFLALLGILVGTASVVAMVSGGELATREALKQFKILGTDLLAVTINDAKSQGEDPDNQHNLSLQQANNILSVNKNMLYVAPYSQLFNTIQFNGHILSGSIIGVTKDFARVAHIEVEAGRFISQFDQYNYYCVIGNALYQEIKKTTMLDAIGKQIQIGDYHFPKPSVKIVNYCRGKKQTIILARLHQGWEGLKPKCYYHCRCHLKAEWS